MTDIGTCEVVSIYSGDDVSIRVARADPHIRISRELLTAAGAGASPHVSLDRDLLTIHADPPVTYRVFDDGNPSDVPASLVQEAPA